MIDVYLSPSLQEWNLGYGNYGTEEERMNQIADIVAYELQRHGLSVARNRPEMSLAEVVAESNSLNPRVHVAVSYTHLDVYKRQNNSRAARFGSAIRALSKSESDQTMLAFVVAPQKSTKRKNKR